MAHICLANLLEEERGKELLLQLVCPAVIHLLTSEGNYDLKLDAISVSSCLNIFHSFVVFTSTIWHRNLGGLAPKNILVKLAALLSKSVEIKFLADKSLMDWSFLP